ncbi:hypothetical protein [Mycobacteroides abscessus]|uniref:hypothetical protein n=1 Tax=Mycobacteroides abscessus TaxID=36809 RepID=UPI001602291B|nr:hypothetical protein [Mycobacteroides abscessus]
MTEGIPPVGGDGDLRSYLDAALASLGSESIADQYERGAIEQAWSKFTGRGE